MPTYLVEAYMSGSHTREARAAGRRARAAAEALSREGTPVLYIRTTFLPDDETCFHLFEAGSVDVVSELCVQAGLLHARIVRAVDATG